LAAYQRYQVLTDALRDWEVVAWSAIAEERLSQLMALKMRIGTMDLRIAAITMSLGALLLSRNLRDFRRVPDLAVEDWTG
jgi:tRNA(fMet)-specific endonuclease VapC